MESKVLSLMRFARKSGALVFGFEAVKKLMLNRRVYLVLVTTDISDNTREKIQRLALEKKIPLIEAFTTLELSPELGLKPTAIYALKNRHFAEKILEYHSGNTE
jgi:ribosomal protein L7Ae-like RNA K-turn-binding protein